MKYKIAFIISHPIQYMSPLFREMAKHPQIDLTVLYCSDEGAKEMWDKEFRRKIKWDIPLLQNYKYKFLKNYSPLQTIFRPPVGLVNMGIVRAMQKDGYDAIILHGWHYITHWLAIITAIFKKIPVFIRSESPLRHELLKPKWKVFIKKIIFGKLFKHASGFFAIGSENKKFYRFYGVEESKIYWTPYAADNERFIDLYNTLINKKKEIKKEMNIEPQKSVILFAGKLIDKKRPLDLLRAYEIIDDERKTLIFLGDGNLKKNLQNYVSQRKLKDVFFTGFKNQTELPKYYVMSDIFVLPSTVGETWGITVNEAMCFHLPIIISDLVGCGTDLVKHGENGFIFRTGNITELAGCLKKLINNCDLRTEMGKNSFEIIKDWDYRSVVEGIIRAFDISLAR